jgi:hypothetical protein
MMTGALWNLVIVALLSMSGCVDRPDAPRPAASAKGDGYGYGFSEDLCTDPVSAIAAEFTDQWIATDLPELEKKLVEAGGEDRRWELRYNLRKTVESVLLEDEAVRRNLLEAVEQVYYDYENDLL